MVVTKLDRQSQYNTQARTHARTHTRTHTHTQQLVIEIVTLQFELKQGNTAWVCNKCIQQL